ncbi:MAG: hypothetical protein ACXVO1_03805 [Tumebacillaceae bacterium]
MEKRMFVLGLGAGILAATLVLGASDTLLGGNSTAQPKTVQESTGTVDWQAAAKQAGMLVMTQKDLDQKLADARTDGVKKKEAELAAKPPATPPAPTTVHVYIQPGMGTTDVATLLQSAGVIEDGNQLITLKQTSPNPIRAGTYNLPLKGKAADVLKAISTPPKY